jgi:ABC-2 type transport system permease protein
MTWLRLVRAELRKLTTTKIPWGFLAVLVVLSAVTAAAVVWGTDADGSKGFISTAEDQQSLTAFGANAMIIAGLFGAIAVSREYGHGTVVPTFLAAPRRHRAVLAQYTAVLLGGALLGLVGAALTVAGVAAALPTTDHGFLMSAGTVTQVLAASTFMGASGAVLGAGIGAIVRNMGGAVTGAVLLLLVIPPLVVQLAPEAISWVPGALVGVLSGLGGDVAMLTAVLVVVIWGAVPAAVGLVLVQRRDVV